MNKFYIEDTTQRKEPFIFESIQGLVKHLEGTVQRKFGKTRANYMQNLIDLGHGYDDREGSQCGIRNIAFWVGCAVVGVTHACSSQNSDGMEYWSNWIFHGWVLLIMLAFKIFRGG